MYVNPEVGPYLMNVFYVMILQNFLHENLYPRRHTYNDTDIPILCLTRYLIEFGIPLPRPRNLFPGFIKMLKPKRQARRLYSTKITFEITSFFRSEEHTSELQS